MNENERRTEIVESLPDLFDPDTKLEDVLLKMMKESRRIFNSNRCSVYLQVKPIDEECLENKAILDKAYDLKEKEDYE
jgi:hypothetical protein